MLNLQLFAEGAGAGDGGTAEGQGVTEAAALPQTKGEKNNPLASVKYGIQDEAPAAEVQAETVAQPDRNAEFERLIKGEYKDLYDAKMQDTIQKRLKGQKETVDKYNALQPVLEILGKKHGVDATDIEALTKAIEEDDSYFEDEAMEKGLTVQQLKEFKRIERENAEFKAQQEELQRQENGKKLYAAWMQQADEAKKVYPSFDMRAEMENPKFLDLLRSNIDVRTAYEVLHKDEIIPAAMQFTAQTVESKLAKKIASNGARPSENGMSSQSAAVVKSDVSQLSKADRAEIIRRVQRGEKIRF
jgi:hypothetical protein